MLLNREDLRRRALKHLCDGLIAGIGPEIKRHKLRELH